MAFEDLTAALLKTQAVQVDSRRVLAALASLHSVEARHAAWIRHIAGDRAGRRRVRRADLEGQGGQAGRVDELRHLGAQDEGKAAA